MVLYSLIACLVLFVGCQEQKGFSLLQVIDINRKTNKPTLVFMADHNSIEYENIRKILNKKEVRKALNKFIFLEVNTLKDNYFNKLTYSCAKNMLFIVEGDSIASTINNVASSSMLIYRLNNYRNNNFAKTVKYCSLLGGDSQLISVEINRIMRTQYLREKRLMSQDEYKSILISTIKKLPYFYNRYLLLKEDRSLTRIKVNKCTDSLSLFEKRIYSLEIKELIDRVFCINTKSKSEINFDTTEINFGIVKSDSCVCHTFYFTNKGDIPLILYNVETSCGCIAASWPRTPVRGGEKDSISISFKSISHGYFCKSIKISSNSDPEVITLHVSGKVD